MPQRKDAYISDVPPPTLSAQLLTQLITATKDAAKINQTMLADLIKVIDNLNSKLSVRFVGKPTPSPPKKYEPIVPSVIFDPISSETLTSCGPKIPLPLPATTLLLFPKTVPSAKPSQSPQPSPMSTVLNCPLPFKVQVDPSINVVAPPLKTGFAKSTSHILLKTMVQQKGTLLDVFVFEPPNKGEYKRREWRPPWQPPLPQATILLLSSPILIVSSAPPLYPLNILFTNRCSKLPNDDPNATRIREWRPPWTKNSVLEDKDVFRAGVLIRPTYRLTQPSIPDPSPI